MRKLHQKDTGYLDWICNVLGKLVRTDILVELNRSELESEVVNQNKEKVREVIKLDDNKEEIKKVENIMKEIKERNSRKKVSSSLTSFWYSSDSFIL